MTEKTPQKVVTKLPLAVKKDGWRQDFKKNKTVYALFLPVLGFFAVFRYAPMFGILMAFQDYKPGKGIFGSQWVGLQKFVELFTGDMFPQALRNTIVMALMNLTIGFVAPILLALLVSQLRSKRYSRLVQTASYMPFFISAVVIVALVREFLGANGPLTLLLTHLGFEQQNWLANADIPVFWIINTFTEIWQNAGYSSILYVTAIAAVNSEMFEAAAIDGANRWKTLWRITLPSIMPTIIMMLTMRVGLVFMQGFDKILLMYMPSTYATADCLSTYTYRAAFGGGNDFSLSTASGLFQSVVAMTLLVISNKLSAKFAKQSLY